MAWYSSMIVKAPGFPAVSVETRYGYPDGGKYFYAPKKVDGRTLSRKERSRLTTLVRKWHSAYERGAPYIAKRMGFVRGHVHRHCRVIYNHIPDLG